MIINGKEIPDKIVELLKKLEALADPTQNPNEFEAAASAAKMQRILLEYDLSVVDIKVDGVVTRLALNLDTNRPGNWVSILLSSVCATFYCNAIGLGHGKFILIGSQVDTVTAKFTFDYLYETVNRLTTRYAENYIGFEHLKTVKTSYSLGVTYSISDKLKEMSKKNEEEAEKATSEASNIKADGINNSSALVLMKEHKNEAIEKFLKKEFPKLQKKTIEVNRNSEKAFYQGRADGRNVSIAKGGGLNDGISNSKLR